MRQFKHAASAVLLTACLLSGQSQSADSLLNDLEWRSIGPAVMGGRISDIRGITGDPALVYVAAGSGGLFRTNDAGMTWTPLFERQSTISIGAIAVDPKNPKILWVGTGESKVRNSVSFGDGLYKSEDGGATWKRMGLENTETISRIVINPQDPNKVLVAAVGHPFGPNEDRGVFATDDGGKTWKKTLFIDDQHGAVGLDLDPSDPNVAYVGMWHFDRKPWTYTSGSEKGGVFRSRDGGQTWQKLTNGLPKLMGRISVKVSPRNPKLVYVLAESKEGTLFRSRDGGETFEKLSSDRELIGRAYYFTDLRAAPDDENHIIVLSDALLESKDGGQHFSRIAASVHGDLHALWIDEKDPRRMWEGNDGGLAVTYDAGHHWEQINNIPLGQFYHASADNRKPFYQVTVGMQDNGSWTGPSRTREPAGIFNDDWRMLNPFTGFNSLSDPDDPDVVLTEQPGGALLRNDLRTREQQAISPQPQSFAGAPASAMKYRFNWDAPLVRSPHGKDTIYLAGNVIFQSADYGKSWEAISRDLTNHDVSKMGNVGGPIAIDNSASEVYGTITALSESPAKRNVLWAGTDDGNVQVTVNGGGAWTNVAGNIPGIPAASPVSHLEASKENEQTAYVSFDRHMFDDMHPYIFKTNDGGKTWQSIVKGLPEKAFVWTVREDPREHNLLYAGTELGLYASFDRGSRWVPLHGKNMPWAIAVRDIFVHPETNDLIVATHGRSLWILDDVAPLQAMAGGRAGAGLFPVRSAYRFSVRPSRFGFGDKAFTGPNPVYGALLSYQLDSPASDIKLQILDKTGSAIRTLTSPKGVGFHRVAWDLRYAGPEGQTGGGDRRGRGGPQGPQALPGSYTARLTVDGKSFDQKVEVVLDPELRTDVSELQKQFNVALELRDMQSSVNAALSRVASARNSEPDIAKQASALLTRPANLRSETGPKLKENLEALATMVDSVNAAPTQAQTHYFEDLKAQFQDTMTQVNALLAKTGQTPAN